MKKIIMFFTIFLLLLAACGGGSTTSQQPTFQQPVPSTVTGVSADEEKAMIEQIKADTESKNVKTTELYIPINNKKAKVGESVVFGTMFNMLNRAPGSFFARVTFIEARDKSSNKIEVDKDTIRSWLRESETPLFQLEDKGSQFVPIVVRVKEEIKPGVKTLPGTYQYEVQFFKQEGAFDDELDDIVKSIYVKVE